MTTLRDAPDVEEPISDACGPETLIREARKLRRRRYLRIAGVLIVVATAIGMGIALSQGGRQGHSGRHANARPKAPRAATPPPPAPKPPGVALPSSGLFTQISVTPNGLLLSGETPATVQSQQPTCVAGTIDPTWLVVGPLQTGSCGNPLLYGQTVAAVNTNIPSSTCCSATISINVANPTTGAVTNGPVVMNYQSLSDTKPVIVYGARWLWIYDVDTSTGPELLQVSAQSGEVVDTIAMPTLYRPLLAADDGGLWIANSENEIPAAPALSYVAAGASAPDVVVSGPSPICWLSASGTSAWVGAGLQGACAKQTTERFEDYGKAALYSTPGGTFPVTVIGNEAEGLWTFQWYSDGQQIVAINPDTGSESVAATLPYIPQPEYVDPGLAQGQGVYFDGALYFLEPPFRVNGWIGYSSIVKVVP
jgi:hypothetical protein